MKSPSGTGIPNRNRNKAAFSPAINEGMRAVPRTARASCPQIKESKMKIACLSLLWLTLILFYTILPLQRKRLLITSPLNHDSKERNALATIQKLPLLFCCILIFHVNAGFAADYQVFWGDIHAHTSYSDDAYLIQEDKGLVPQRPGAALQYAAAADLAHLDFVALTDHAEHIELYRDGDGNLIPDGAGNPINEWQDIIAQCGDGLAPSDLVVFVGFEYTKTAEDAGGNPVPGAGHKCVIFKDSPFPPTPHQRRGRETVGRFPLCRPAFGPLGPA